MLRRSRRERLPSTPGDDRGHSAEQIIRQRRSAVDMDGKTSLSRSAFYRLLSRTVPQPGRFPFAVLPWSPHVSLAIFVHRVDGLEPGLYVLVQARGARIEPPRVLAGPLHLGPSARVSGWAESLHLSDRRRAQTAKVISCQQDIAADGVCALGMLAEFDSSLRRHGPAFYPRLFWETGLIGQVLYLEAEAAGIRGTGIGCFFDDAMHDMLGIVGREWQSLYHFTLGGPVEDPRVQTIPPYAHLQAAAQ